MNLILLALAPGIAIALFIYSRDRYNREPLKYLLISFALGMLSILPPLVLQPVLKSWLDFHAPRHSLIYYGLFAWGVVAITEEGSKFLVLRGYAFPKKQFDEPFDGIVYSVMVGMGFATLENILYVTSHGYLTGLLRMFLSVPAHGSFAVLMGYHAGLAKFDPGRRTIHLLRGFLLAVLFHGAFDFFLFLQESAQVTQYVSTGLLMLGALASYGLSLRLAIRSIRNQQRLSRKNYEDNRPAS